MELYNKKRFAYFSNPRFDILSIIPKKPNLKILEIGAGAGDTLVKIKELNLAIEVVGVDITKLENSNQTHSLIDQFILGDITDNNFNLKENYFDVIIMADVIEHIYDPDIFISSAKKFLNSKGTFLISLPNFREYRNLGQIALNGDFRYSDSGILDRTHFKFYCKKNMIELFLRNKLTVIKTYPNFVLWPSMKKVRLKNNLTLGLLEEFFALQYIFILEK